MAIASLICAFVCTPLGLIFGFVARSQIKRTGQKGNGLALAGILISLLSIAIVIIAFAVAASNSGSSTGY
jgi:peptidyl-prolyl cis-trans isomerase B (cyclophilin B)